MCFSRILGIDGERAEAGQPVTAELISAQQETRIRPNMPADRTAILHVGTYKTGSSSIQNLLYKNRDLLATHGMLYPQSGLTKDAVIGHRHRRLIPPVLSGKTSSYVTQELQSELKTAPQHSVIISNEAWSNPRLQPMLGGFVTELADMGFSRIAGILFLRRLIDYKVSHYREFTFRQGNKTPFHNYLLQPPGMFDYLFIMRNFRAIFRSDLHVLDYSRINNSVPAFFDALGLCDILPKLVPVEKANIKPVGALGVEVMRHVNMQGLNRKKGLRFIDYFESRNPGLFKEEWTERDGPETFRYGGHYRKELADVLGWPAEDVDRLLEDRPLSGQSLEKARPLIEAELTEWIRRTTG